MATQLGHNQTTPAGVNNLVRRTRCASFDDVTAFYVTWLDDELANALQRYPNNPTLQKIISGYHTFCDFIEKQRTFYHANFPDPSFTSVSDSYLNNRRVSMVSTVAGQLIRLDEHHVSQLPSITIHQVPSITIHHGHQMPQNITNKFQYQQQMGYRTDSIDLLAVTERHT